MWPFKSKKQKQEEEKNRGYEYASGKLLRGVLPREIYSYHFNDYTPFDTGVEQALNDWEKKTGEDYMGTNHT